MMMATETAATAKQIAYIRALNRQAGGRKDTYVSQLECYVPQRLRNKAVDQLTKSEASEVIDALRSI